MKSLLDPEIKVSVFHVCIDTLFPPEIEPDYYLKARVENYFRQGLNLSRTPSDIFYTVPEYLHSIVFKQTKISQTITPTVLEYIQDNLQTLEEVKQYYLIQLLV